ncbi:hypothetical protein KILIM_034_00130 [Kineosphaera limosa NBRC 100340]|uniref:DUF559 domain-containing protein n=1 Tax=Kineosphaera limosa NBRC 100340 TaxID=1184609 RepID=K6XBR5_9MICO|nr:hypothetical protein KILIM_034_00130 [Kineosphaera limosa NBRC 100340]
MHASIRTLRRRRAPAGEESRGKRRPYGSLRLSRSERARRAWPIARDHDGVAHRAQLRQAGVSRADVRSEVAAGRWRSLGRHTVRIHASTTGRARLWRAVWESGPGARLDGVSALLADGLTGFSPDAIDVTVPAANHAHALAGVRLHRPRSAPEVVSAGIPRVRPDIAAIRGALWAHSERQAALIICLAVQQGLVEPGRLMAAAPVTKSGRGAFVRTIVTDVCDGSHSLGELDFARLRRSRGLPTPSRQAVRVLPDGRVYLDVYWAEHGLVVEIDGGHHTLALEPVRDALRQNDLTLTGDRVLRIPLLGLRLEPDKFLDQVERGLGLAHPLGAARQGEQHPARGA